MKNIGLYNDELSVPRKEDVDAKQDKITTSGILKGDGSGGISAAVANTDYATCTKLLNGRAIGSLRTSSASAEDSTYTMGQNAFAQGNITKASGNYSHAEGSGTMATAPMSHAEGVATITSGYASHAEGVGTTANHNSQHAQGQFNIADNSTADLTDRGNYAYIVGNGTSDTERSNAHTLDWSGNAWFAGDVYVGSTSGTNKDDGSKKLITADKAGNQAQSIAENYSVQYFYCQGNIKSGITGIINSNIYNIIDEYGNIWQSFTPEIIAIPRPALVAPFSGDIISNGVVLPLNAIDFQTGTALFSGLYCDSGGNIFLGKVTLDYKAQGIMGTSFSPIPNDSEVFIAEVNTTEYEDVLAAYNAGKIIYAKDEDGRMYQLSAEMDAPTVFSFINFYTAIEHTGEAYETKGYTLSSESGWSEEITYDNLLIQPSNSLPLASGTAAVGTSNKYARADHVHPGEVFIAEYGKTTQDEINNAYNNGMVVFCKNGDDWAVPIDLGSSLGATFSRSGSTFNWLYSVSGSNWTQDHFYYVDDTTTINGKSLTSNITLGVMYSATLPASGWATSGDWKTQTVAVSGLKATYNAAPFVDVALTGTDATGDAELAAAWLGISETLIADTAANSITVKFPATVDTPTANIPITITTYD